MSHDLEASINSSPVGSALRDMAARHPGRYLLAVSGGRDSMVLLDAASRMGLPVAAVATYDHGTGPAATKAAALVERTAERLGFPSVAGRRVAATNDTEATWRAARRAFLSGWASEFKAAIVTAHTRDDQIETVAMRILRGSGVRGLAGMFTDSGPLRPFLSVSRPQIASWADDFSVRWIEDPSNSTRAFLRNRVRHDLLPALESVRPGLSDELLEIAARAAEWRRDVEAVVASLAPTTDGAALVVRRDALRPFDRESLGVLWPALAARVGVTLDRRGTERLALFTTQDGDRGIVPLAGGASVERTTRTLILRPAATSARLY